MKFNFTPAEVKLRIEMYPSIRVQYTNYKGITAIRSIIPLFPWYGRSKWHSEKQWFLQVIDVDKKEVRDFAMKDIKEFL